MAYVTGLEFALIPAGAALIGVALGIGGNAYLDRLRDRREGRRLRDAAIGELLAATADLLAGVATLKAAYTGQASRYHHYLTLTGRLIAVGALAIADVDPAELPAGASGGLILRAYRTCLRLATWARVGLVFDRLTTIDRDIDDRQRTVALDASSVLTPRMVRFYAALAALTLGAGMMIADAARDLAPGVSGLMDVVMARPNKYARARRPAEAALVQFRTAADKRQR